MSLTSISLSTPMIHALREGKKTQTRRIINPQPVNFEVDPEFSFENITTGSYMTCAGYDEPPPGYRRQRWWRFDDRTNGILEFTRQGKRGTTAQIRRAAKWHNSRSSKWAEREVVTLCQYGKPGDTLKVKEAAWLWCEKVPDGKTKTGRDKFRYIPMDYEKPRYKAEHPERPTQERVKRARNREYVWHLKIPRFLPRWAVRTRIQIESIRVERLNEISDADAKAEGVTCDRMSAVDAMIESREPSQMAFEALWESIHGPGSFDSRWVWALSFRVVESPTP